MTKRMRKASITLRVCDYTQRISLCRIQTNFVLKCQTNSSLLLPKNNMRFQKGLLGKFYKLGVEVLTLLVYKLYT